VISRFGALRTANCSKTGDLLNPDTSPVIKDILMPLLFAATIFSRRSCCFWSSDDRQQILPWFGGAGGVDDLLLFFQALLAGRYAYAHASLRLPSPRMRAVLHVALLLVSAATLPIIVGPRGSDRRGAARGADLLLLAATIGCRISCCPPPSAGAGVVCHHLKRIPYRLFSLSNVGRCLRWCSIRW